MDKSWMRAIKWSKAYVDGVNTFMKFIETHLGKECNIRCPCVGCLNLIIQDPKIVKDHMLERGIDPGYTTWFYHGEPSSSNNRGNSHSNEGDRSGSDLYEEDEEYDGVNDMLFDLGQQFYQADNNNMSDSNNTSIGGVPEYLEALMMGAQTELYPGCKKISRISFIIQLLHIKVYCGASNKLIDMILRLMKLSYPDGDTLPSSYYEVKKILRDLGLGYECIHACKNDYALFWKENQNLEACPTCGTSRWKVNDGIGKKIPQKILRYFPLKPRLQRLFMSQKTSKKMVWHKEKRIDDEYMRHPADSLAWKDFDSEFPWFANDPRNVRLALAADGFNPFGNLSTTYSMWPVLLAPLNLPPWDCMKQPFFMLSLLIPGKNSPGKDIDVYLQPLIEELKELWVQGVETFDVSTKKNFQMHVVVLWTINDFPAHGDLSGWSTKGYMADSLAWKDFDSEFPWFANDPRNVRLALAADGFNPFGNLSTTYSMWPVLLAPLNLPPWDCMKQPFFMLSLLIPGKNSPGKDIDVYLQPLIEELKELWVQGVETFDVSTKKNFQMHVAVLWTINDFPAYGDLSGWSTKGYMACPVCNDQTYSQGLRNKVCYMGHRRFLPKDHPWRRSRKFNGKREDGEAPRELTGEDVLIQLERLQGLTLGKHGNRKRKRNPEELNWTKRSIFFVYLTGVS